AGSWGTAFALLLARRGLSVRLWVREPDILRELERSRVNSTFLPGFPLPEGVTFHNDFQEALKGSSFLFVAVPSPYCRSVYTEMKPCLKPEQTVVSLTKGIEEGSLKRMSEVMEEIFDGGRRPSTAVLSGPSFAAEVAAGLPTAVVAAGSSPPVAVAVQRLVSGPLFRVYTSADLVGVELAGAVKNIIAIAAGFSDALGYGHNARAALLTRGLAETVRLGLRCGARPETFSGLAGMGDLILTCTGDLSRNRKLGLEMGRGRLLDEITSETSMVAEGLPNSLSAIDLARRLGVEMPIGEMVYRVLYRGLDPREALRELMSRSLKEE
ncbi:MAG: NAD(P)-dependent glycerol-3-phosphate dehydrogenase, partial [Candidatus Aminicenantes bacterium]|nr:NAD(P)-dependent glycerol-3-phosphate dehydrogenase [Candidatus Aminicenantes bacterium]